MTDKKLDEPAGFASNNQNATTATSGIPRQGSTNQLPLQDPFLYLLQRNQQQQLAPDGEYSEQEVRKRLFQCSRSGNLPLMVKTLNLIQGTRESDRMFRKRDPEGRFIFNNVLMNGHAHILNYLLEHWVDAHANLPLTLEGNTTVLHQALTKAAFLKAEKAKSSPAESLQHERLEEEKINSAQRSEKKRYEAPALSEDSFIQMIRLLLQAKEKLSGAGISIDSQDRLGRTVLHMAAQHGLTHLTKLLLTSEARDGLGADALKADIINQRPIHYAIAYKQEDVFEIFLEHLQSSDAGSMLTQLDCNSIPYRLASFCVVKQSWRCFAQYLERFGLTRLHTSVLTLEGFDEEIKNKTARQHAEESGLLAQYEQIVSHFYTRNATANGEFALSNKKQLDKIVQGIEEATAKRKTLIITDYRCVEHADFPHKRNIKEKANQRDRQPENSDRLALLVDNQIGVLSTSAEFSQKLRSTMILKDEVEERAKIADILKIHDFNYIQKVMEDIAKLRGTDNKVISVFDNMDTVVSEKTWTAALISAGAAIEAVDAVMAGTYRNAFCATRPPGHHAGIFGKTFHPEDKRKACSNGFCFINNVAMAASYTLSTYRQQIKKIAIIDFDVHHGNGTQEIVEALMKPKQFTVSNDCSPFSIFEISTNRYQPWLDFKDGKNVLFVSVHLYNNGSDSSDSNSNSDLPSRHDMKQIFYPGTGGSDENTNQTDPEFPGGILNIPVKPGEASSAQWRKHFTETVFRRLAIFRPDFIFCSSGFDAHEKDSIHGPEDTGINEFDYEWLTEQLQKAANQFAKGRLVSVFEGGYNINLGSISPLVQSVAAHVRALQGTHAGPLFQQKAAQQSGIEEEASEQHLEGFEAYERYQSQYSSMITEARGEILGFSNFFLPVNPSMIRKRRATAMAGSPEERPGTNNKFPSASELALFNASMPSAGSANEAAADNKTGEEQAKQENCDGQHDSSEVIVYEEGGEDEFYDPEELPNSSHLAAANGNDIQIDLPNVDDVDDEPDAF